MRPLRILHLEDDPLFAELTQILVARRHIDCVWTTVETASAYREAAQHNQYDAIVSDFTVPEIDGQSALELAQHYCPNTPFIFLSGNTSEQVAAACVEAGALAFVFKDHSDELISILSTLNERAPLNGPA